MTLDDLLSYVIEQKEAEDQEVQEKENDQTQTESTDQTSNEALFSKDEQPVQDRLAIESDQETDIVCNELMRKESNEDEAFEEIPSEMDEFSLNVEDLPSIEEVFSLPDEVALVTVLDKMGQCKAKAKDHERKLQNEEEAEDVIGFSEERSLNRSFSEIEEKENPAKAIIEDISIESIIIEHGSKEVESVHRYDESMEDAMKEEPVVFITEPVEKDEIVSEWQKDETQMPETEMVIDQQKKLEYDVPKEALPDSYREPEQKKEEMSAGRSVQSLEETVIAKEEAEKIIEKKKTERIDDFKSVDEIVEEKDLVDSFSRVNESEKPQNDDLFIEEDISEDIPLKDLVFKEVDQNDAPDFQSVFEEVSEIPESENEKFRSFEAIKDDLNKMVSSVFEETDGEDIRIQKAIFELFNEP